MAFRDDVITATREALGEGFQNATLPVLKNEVFRQWLQARIRSHLRRGIDVSAFEVARTDAEDALRVETAARKQAEDDVDSLIEANIGSV